MNWFSSISGLTSKFAVGASKYDPELDDAGFDDHPSASVQTTQSMMAGSTVAKPLNGSSAPFFQPSGMDWSPSEADRIYVAFDTSQPVARPADLRGRDAELARLLSGVLHRRNHGVISGTRGSGKTSLVRVFGQYADRQGVVVIYAACDSATSFGDLLRDFLEQVPASSLEADQVGSMQQRVAHFGPDSSPHQATSILAQVKYSQVIFIVDEFDRVNDRTTQAKVAALLKLVSDARLQVRFVLVGGSSAFSDIFNQHPSLVRHITRLSTEPLSEFAIFDVLDSCSNRCGMSFTQSGKELIQQVACGSPYHARLFGMHSALRALDRKATEIDAESVLAGLEASFKEWAALNHEDAVTFESVVSGSHGDPSAFSRIACELAATADDPLRVVGSNGAWNDYDFIEAAFGTAVERIDGRVTFRDATAPQFFLVLQKLSSAPKAILRSKGKS